jgi:hypothetical protein
MLWFWELADKLERLFKRVAKAQLPMITLPSAPSKSNPAANTKN